MRSLRGPVVFGSWIAAAVVVACGSVDGTGTSVVDDIGVPGSPDAGDGTARVDADVVGADVGVTADAVADAGEDATAVDAAEDADAATDADAAGDADTDAGDGGSDAEAGADAAADSGANGSACVSYLECLSRVCANGLCVASTCTDGKLDGDESDVDCGGSCAACAPGATCGGSSDCASLSCVSKKCAAPACDDGVKNGGEADVDCGGGCAKKCDVDASCKLNTDCATGLCTTGHCARAKTLVLMHFDGVNAGASFPEERGRAVVATGGVTTSTIEKKLGTASAYFSDPAMKMRIPYASDLTLGTDDFTVEYWWYPLAFPARGSLYVVTDDAPTTWLFGLGRDLSSTLSFTFQNHKSVGSPALGDGFAVTPASFDPGWHHFAVTRSGNTFRLFLDGQLLATQTPAPGPNIVGNPADILLSFTNGGGSTTGYVDELRISSVARYTASFTPSTTAFDLD